MSSLVDDSDSYLVMTPGGEQPPDLPRGGWACDTDPSSAYLEMTPTASDHPLFRAAGGRGGG